MEAQGEALKPTGGFAVTRVNVGYAPQDIEMHNQEKIRVIVVSDTHNLASVIPLPAGDLLLHAGDMTQRCKKKELKAFNTWLGEQTHIRHKIVIAGNHEKQSELLKPILTNCIVLEDERIKVLGLHIYGTTWKADWSLIPEGLHILLAHSPPSGQADVIYSGKKVGSDSLARAVERTKPQLHIFGHNHQGYGVTQDEHTVYINAATCVGKPSVCMERRPAMYLELIPSCKVDTTIKATIEEVTFPLTMLPPTVIK